MRDPNKRDLDKQHLYDGVKSLIECDAKHIQLPQHKLFTLFSLAFQYMLYNSTKDPGHYIIRVEDSALAEKLARKSKDPSTRKFIQSLMIPRKFKFQKSMFYLDYFHVGTWNLTSDLPKEKVKAAIIVKNTQAKPMNLVEDEEGEEDIMASLPPNYFLTTLKDFCPRTITIAYDEDYDGLEKVEFDFIVKEKEKTISGVTLGGNVDWENFD